MSFETQDYGRWIGARERRDTADADAFARLSDRSLRAATSRMGVSDHGLGEQSIRVPVAVGGDCCFSTERALSRVRGSALGMYAARTA